LKQIGDYGMIMHDIIGKLSLGLTTQATEFHMLSTCSMVKPQKAALGICINKFVQARNIK